MSFRPCYSTLSGIELIGHVMSVVIPRNTPIPCVKTSVYTTDHDNQTEDDVIVYEGLCVFSTFLVSLCRVRSVVEHL